MNLEDLKKSLIEMIDEANYLEDNELVEIPEVNVKVKKGRKEEFLNDAKLYYEMTNQVILTKENALEYIKQVYHDISKENFEKLEHLNKDLQTNLNRQKKYQKIEDSLKIKAAIEPGSWETITDTQDLLKDLKDTEQKIRNSIADIKNRVNNVVKKAVEKEMEQLRTKDKEQKQKNHTAGLDGSYILNEDKEVYDNLYLLLRVIENASENLPLINVDDALLVNPHQEATARLLLPELKKLKNKEGKKQKPKLLDVNTELKEQIALELTELIKNAKNHPEEPLAEGKEVLASDLEKYNLLAKQFEILTMIYDTDELVMINQAEIPKEKEEEYKDICKKLEILKEVKPTDSTVTIDGANISILKMDEYINLSQKLNHLQKETTSTVSNKEPELLETAKEPLKRKAVKMIRKVTKKEWWKKNGKKVVGIGLSLTVAAFTLTTLAPTLIYLNSCLAMANPAIAGTLGSINNVLVTIGGVAVDSLNFNAATSNLLGALGTSAVKLGLIGGGAVAAYKIFKHKDKEFIPEAKEKESAINKIKELGKELIEKTKELT